MFVNFKDSIYYLSTFCMSGGQPMLWNWKIQFCSESFYWLFGTCNFKLRKTNWWDLIFHRILAWKWWNSCMKPFFFFPCVSDMSHKWHSCSCQAVVSQSRALCWLACWLTWGYELLKVAVPASVSWISAEDGSGSTVWPVCVLFSFQHVMSGRCCLDQTSSMMSIASDTQQSSVTGNHERST